MSDLISRSALEQSFDVGCVGECGCCKHHHCKHVSFGKWEEWCKLIKNAPTVDAVEVVHARWVQEDEDEWRCTRCGAFWIFIDGGPEENDAKFCPVCGAKMDATDNNVGHKDGGATDGNSY